MHKRFFCVDTCGMMNILVLWLMKNNTMVSLKISTASNWDIWMLKARLNKILPGRSHKRLLTSTWDHNIIMAFPPCLFSIQAFPCIPPFKFINLLKHLNTCVCIPKYRNSACPIHILLLVGIVVGLVIQHWVTSWCVLSCFSCSPHSFPSHQFTKPA